MKIKKLKIEQKQTRKRILEISHASKLSHLGSCLSAVDLIDAVYQVKERKEKFVLSNGHAGVALYVILEKHGLVDGQSLERLHVHPDRNPDLSIDVSTGSLGHGLPIAVGMALADRKRFVYCTISDAETNEGSIWEALRIASEQKLVNLGKAGRARWLGIRPNVRGSAMNPVDHPHGGGEGRQPIGMPHPKTPWGKPALGVKTRNRKKKHRLCRAVRL